MPIDLKQVQQSFKKLRKNLQTLKPARDPAKVHRLRTRSRRIESVLESVDLSTANNERKLLKELSEVRSRAEKVRDLDVLISYLAEVSFAVFYQEPVRYNATAGENIAYGDLSIVEPGLAMKAAVCAAGAEEIVERLPRGLNSLLGKMFLNGSELSGGEWQRLGLARTFFRAAPIIVLDEPTSAMDPWAEAQWAEQFRLHAKESIALIITHRLTTAMCADLICVLDGGKIVESGTHENLLAENGLYAQGWASQPMVSELRSNHEAFGRSSLHSLV